ncbi:hypothetical protein QTP86_002801, partial [Hemibagrus guttatus]
AQRKDAARPGFVHSGAGVPRSLDAAAAEDASQPPGRGPLPLRRHLSSRSRRRTASGAVVLHAGTNDIRLRQTEILKKDFSLVELVRTTSSTTRIIVSGPLPTFQRGIESVLGSTVLMACTQAELEQLSSQTTSPGYYAPSDWPDLEDERFHTTRAAAADVCLKSLISDAKKDDHMAYCCNA